MSTLEYSPSLTRTWKVTVVGSSTPGKRTWGDGPPAPKIGVAGPSTCVHSYASARPSGSVPVAESVTTRRSVPKKSSIASTVGAWLSASMNAHTVSTTVFVPSETSTSNRTQELTSSSGASKLGVAVSAPDSDTAGPPRCAQRYVRSSPSGSLAPIAIAIVVPSVPRKTGGCSITGASLSALMVIATLSVVSCTPSDTVSSNTTVVFASASGAVKLGSAELGSSSTTAGPETCRHEKVNACPSGSVPEPRSL